MRTSGGQRVSVIHRARNGGGLPLRGASSSAQLRCCFFLAMRVLDGHSLCVWERMNDQRRVAFHGTRSPCVLLLLLPLTTNTICKQPGRVIQSHARSIHRLPGCGCCWSHKATMSSNRLRKHLSNLDAEDQATANESFVLIGTPLPSLLTSKRTDPNEGKPIWEQEVRDEQGRRRFHGAFTGGWSAGYFNTVGSKEGWTPTSFVSSRRDRVTGPGANQQQRPEDFMDDEDLAELDQARHLTQRDEYSAKERARHTKGDVLNDLLGLGGDAPGQQQGEANIGLVAPRTSLGHRILTKMGWKPGSGLGPLMTRARRRVLERLYIGKASEGSDSGDGDDKTLVPPPDTPMPGVVEEQTSTQGLGWVSEKQVRSAGSKTKPASRSTLDGLSSLKGGGDDDDDEGGIYGRTESVQDAIARRAGDASVVDHGDTFRLSEPTTAEASRTDTWKDGRRLPSGFVLAHSESTQTQGEWFPPPRVPSDWKPDPNRVWQRAAAAAAGEKAVPVAQPNLKASDRASLLGEARIPGPPPSLGDYVRPPGPPPVRPPPATTAVDAPRLDVATAKAALNGSVPFGNDVAKQDRYKAYLRTQRDPSTAAEPYPIPPGQTAQQVTQELQEFARSANIFKPMSSAMASRFASAATSEGAGDVHVPTAGLYQPAIKSREERDAEREAKEKEETERAAREKEASMTNRQRAAKEGQFGHLTREVMDWFPPRLLCKRFGVPDPHPERREDEQEEEQSQPSNAAAGFDPFNSNGQSEQYQRSEARREIQRGEARWEKSRRELMGLVGERKWEEQGGQPIAGSSRDAPAAAITTTASSSPSSPSSPFPSSSSASRTRSSALNIEHVGLGEDAEQLREIDNFVKPSRSVFRSVFASDDEDGEGEGDVGADDPAPRPPDDIGPATAVAASSGPTFVPRSKRKEGGEESMSAIASSHKRKKKKKAPKRGALTFSMDDGDGDGDADGDGDGDGDAKVLVKPTQRSKAVVDEPATAESPRPPGAQPVRMRASDLF